MKNVPVQHYVSCYLYKTVFYIQGILFVVGCMFSYCRDDAQPPRGMSARKAYGYQEATSWLVCQKNVS
jgi:uncharacterized membrane protein